MKKITFVCILIAVIAITVYSCKKAIETEPAQPATADQITSIKSWLRAQQSITQNIPWINKVLEASNWNASESVEYSPDATIVTIPLNADVENKVGTNIIKEPVTPPTNILIFQIGKNGEIMHGNIGQISAADAGSGEHASTLVNKIFNKKSDEFNGLFNLYSITKVFLYQLVFKENKQFSRSLFATKTKNSGENSVKVNKASQKPGESIKVTKTMTIVSTSEKSIVVNGDCIDWYWDTWDVYGNLTEIYLYTRCGGGEACQIEAIVPGQGMQPITFNCMTQSQNDPECQYTESQAKAIVDAMTADNSYSSTSSDDGETTDPTNAYMVKSKNTIWKFATFHISAAYNPEYSAVFNGNLRKDINVPSPAWYWTVFMYSTSALSGGRIPPCTIMSVTVSVSTVVSSFGTYAQADLTYFSHAEMSCMGNSQVGDVVSATLPNIFYPS